MFLQLDASKCLKIRFKIGCLLSCLLNVDKMLVNPLSWVHTLCLMIHRSVLTDLRNKTTIICNGQVTKQPMSKEKL